jgi:D-3-phosphoglycerate dehydrogenase
VSDLIFVALSTFAERDRRPLEMLERSGIPFRLNPTGRRIERGLLLDLGREATAVVAGVEPYDAGVIGGMPRLRCIARCGAGIENVDLEVARRRGIAVLNTPDAPTGAVAELALAMILALSRGLPRQAALMRERRWERVEAHLLAGKRVGIVGLGRIGRRLAELLRPFGVRMLATDPAADPAAARSLGVELVDLETLLASSDVVSLHAAASRVHPLRLGARELALMPKGAMLINLARGDMVDDVALASALRSGHLRGAAADVFPEEPYRGPLCDLDSAILTPHAATYTMETRTAMELECVEKLLRHLAA